MKYLNKINEWLDSYHTDELKDLFIPLKDFDIENFQINKNSLGNSINITWIYKLRPSIQEGYIDSNVILKHRLKLNNFLEYTNELHEILERLIVMGYNINYFESDHKKLIVLKRK